jgi:hypothetical protein
MLRYVVPFALLTAAPVAAETKAETCAYQGAVVTSVQSARVAKVREAKVADTIAGLEPTWPEKYNAMIPLVTPWVYELPKDQLDQNLGAVWVEQCMAQ